MKPSIIVCGLGQTGLKIYSLLKQQGGEVIGISDRHFPTTDSNIIVGNPRDNSVLIRAGIREAKAIVLANDDDALNLAILTQARLLNPHIRVVNRLFNQTLGEKLDHTLPNHFSMSVAALAAPIFAFAAQGNEAVGQLQLYNQNWPIQEEFIDANHPWLGKSLQQLWDNPTRMLIYYLPAGGEIDLVSAVTQGYQLEIGDYLIIGNQPLVRQKRRRSLKKLLKAAIHLPLYQHHVRPVTLVLLSLLTTIFIATVTYVSVSLNTSFVDALYFSVGMITGAGGKEEVAEHSSDSIKVFTAIMMVVGAGVIGICYALINDFILGSRLKQFWDAARVPNRNHIVICGLGGIGIHIARQLQSQGDEVVIIESDSNNRFLHTARSLGIPIIEEDASIKDTLTAANVETAAALIAVTSDDTTNLEIALTAKAVAPAINLIVRSNDPQFAQSMQEVFEFDTVLSPIELASYSFSAAALGGKILGNGMTKDLLWVALATMITPRHPFCNQRVCEAAITTDFVPLYLESHGSTIHGWKLLEIILSPGDVLYLTMPASSLQQLWRTPPTEELILN